MLLGDLQGGMYCIKNDDKGDKGLPSKACCTAAVSADIWHLRLGHIPFNKLKLALPPDHIQDLSKNVVCKICPMAKQTRLSFPRSYIKTTGFFSVAPFRHLGALSNQDLILL